METQQYTNYAFIRTVIFIFHRSLSKTWEIVMALELSRMIIW